jgi:hypothetical protein
MQTTEAIAKRKQGQQMLTDEKMALTDQIYEEMEQGYHSINALSERLRVNRTTIRRYKPFAQKRFEAVKVNRAAIRTLEISRANRHREWLMNELTGCTSIKEKMSVSNQITKVSQLIALLSGISIEAKVTQYNDPKQLVIVRAHPDAVKSTMQEVEAENDRHQR